MGACVNKEITTNSTPTVHTQNNSITKNNTFNISINPPLLIDGYQRQQCHSKHKNHFNVSSISRLILNYYHQHTKIHTNSNQKQLSPLEWYNPASTSNINDIYIYDNWFLIHYTNGDLSAYYETQKCDGFPIKNVQSIIIETKVGFKIIKTLIIITYKKNMSYIEYLYHETIDGVGLSPKKSDLKQLKITNPNGQNLNLCITKMILQHKNYPIIYFLTDNGRIYCGQLHDFEIRSTYNPSKPLIISDLSNCFKNGLCVNIKDIVTTTNVINVMFVIDKHDFVWVKHDLEWYIFDNPLLYAQPRNIYNYDDDNTSFNYHRLFYKDIHHHIKVKQIGLGETFAVALDVVGSVYCWGADKALRCGISEVPSKLKLSVNDKHEIDVKYEYLNVDTVVNKYDSYNKLDLRFDYVSCGFEHTFVVNEKYNICVAWGKNQFGQLINKSKHIIGYNHQNSYNAPSRVLVVEQLMRNYKTKVIAKEYKTFVCVRYY